MIYDLYILIFYYAIHFTDKSNDYFVAIKKLIGDEQ